MNETKTTNTTTNRPNVWELTTTAEELTLCEVIRFIDLRAMHQSNGTDRALQDLITGCYLDTIITGSKDKDGNTKTHTAQEKEQEADKLRKLAKAERAIADQARKILNRVKVTDEERTEAYYILQEYTTLADNDSAEAHDIEKVNQAQTFSLSQDMLHTIWLELQDIKANPDRQTPEAFGELCKAGRMFIQSLTAVTTIDSNHTISRPLSKAEAVELMTRYGADPKARPRSRWTQTAKGCTGYYTLEPKERKKDLDPEKVDPAIIANYARYNDACIWFYENITLATTHSAHRTAYPALSAKACALRFWNRLTQAEKATALELDPAENQVLYLVLHVPTIRKHSSMEELTDHDPRTAEQISASTIANIDIPKLAELAKLSLQARTAIEALTHPEAVELAKTARNKVIQEGEDNIEWLQILRKAEGKKPYSPGKVKQMQDQYKQTAENAYTSALWSYALTKAGYSKTAQAKAKSTLTTKLKEALKTAPDSATPGAIDFAKLMRQSYRGHATAPGKVFDAMELWRKAEAVTIIDKDGKEYSYTITKNRPQAVKWTDSGNTPESLTPGKDYRAEEVLSRDSYRQSAPKATPPERTPQEERQWERLCKRDAELAELWKSFDSIYGAMEQPKRHA